LVTSSSAEAPLEFVVNYVPQPEDFTHGYTVWRSNSDCDSDTQSFDPSVPHGRSTDLPTEAGTVMELDESVFYDLVSTLPARITEPIFSS
jgi:hypothetical protein